jgi:hypothetical protein
MMRTGYFRCNSSNAAGMPSAPGANIVHEPAFSMMALT